MFSSELAEYPRCGGCVGKHSYSARSAEILYSVGGSAGRYGGYVSFYEENR